MIRSVASMRASKSDDAQYQAGRKLQGQFELTEIGSVRAIDSSVEPVDGRGAFVSRVRRRWHKRGLAQAQKVVLAHQAQHPLVIGLPAFAPQENADPSVAVVAMLEGQALNRVAQPRLFLTGRR